MKKNIPNLASKLIKAQKFDYTQMRSISGSVNGPKIISGDRIQ